MFELLVPATKAQMDRVQADKNAYDLRIRPALMLQTIRTLQDAGVEPDVWKIEGLDRREDCERVVEIARRDGRQRRRLHRAGTRRRREKGRGAGSTTAASVPGFIGFAVGRTTFWDAVADYEARQATRQEAASRIAQRYREWAAIFERARTFPPSGLGELLLPLSGCDSIGPAQLVRSARHRRAHDTVMNISPLAGKPATPAMLVDVPRLVTAYYTDVPDPSVPAQRVAFGTSGHRGSAFDAAFNEWHVLAITQAICHYRKQQGIDGPLFLGIDTHALSEPACASALEVLAANGVDVMLAERRRIHADAGDLARDPHLQPRPHRGLADGIVITPSHNPPDDGGFKYNPPNGGPADTDVTGWIEAAANELLERGLRRRAAHAATRRRCAPRTTHRHDYLGAYVGDLGNVIDMDAIRGAGIRIGVDPLGGAGVHYWARDRRALRPRPHRRQRRGRSDLPLHDGRLGRPDPHGPVVALRDAAPDRAEGSLRHRLRLRHRPRPARHRHPERGAAAAESLSGGGDRLPVPAPAAVAQRRRRSARPSSAAR